MLAAAIVALLAASGVAAARTGERRKVERDLASRAATIAVTVQAAADEASASVVALARDVAASGSPSTLPSLRGRVAAPALGEVVWLPTGSEAGTDAELAATLDHARDTGDAVLSAPLEVDDEGARSAVVAVPVYRGELDGSLTTAPGIGVGSARRDRLAGWVIGDLLIDRLLQAGPSSADVRLLDGEVVLADSDPASDPTVVVPLDVGDRSWRLEAAPADDAGWGRDAVAIAVVGALAALAALALLTRAMAEWGRERDERATIDGRLDLYERVAPVVQQSLDLGEVIPAVAVLLMDHFGLAGVSASADEQSGRPVDMFSIGVDPDPSAVPSIDHGPLAAGATLAIRLERAGRGVGTLRVLAGRPLGGDDVSSLWTVAQSITAAVVNARLYEQQQRAIGEMERVDELKTVFLGTASHELRTPVTAISGFARLVNEEWETLGEEQRRLFVDRIRANATALDTLVQDLLDFSRLERGKVRVEPVPVDLGAMVNDLANRLAPVLSEHQISTAVDDDVHVMADPSGVDRIVTNLLSNATKFAPAGTEIRLVVERTAGGGTVVVDDAGPGVPLDEREHIFSRFFRGGGSDVVRTRGAGIGLSVVSEFVDQMGGSIEVGDSPLGGARFIVTLPGVPAEHAEAAMGPSA